MQAMKYATATSTCVRTERAGGRSSLSRSDSCASARHASARAPLPSLPFLRLRPAQTVKASKRAQIASMEIAREKRKGKGRRKVVRMMQIECLLHALKMKASTSS
jgi:hypothetical protein